MTGSDAMERGPGLPRHAAEPTSDSVPGNIF
jgi:hypothetical protein